MSIKTVESVLEHFKNYNRVVAGILPDGTWMFVRTASVDDFHGFVWGHDLAQATRLTVLQALSIVELTQKRSEFTKLLVFSDINSGTWEVEEYETE